MSGRKTAISLDETLLKEVEETARDLNTSESEGEVITSAPREFMIAPAPGMKKNEDPVFFI